MSINSFQVPLVRSWRHGRPWNTSAERPLQVAVAIISIFSMPQEIKLQWKRIEFEDGATGVGNGVSVERRCRAIV